MNHMGRALINVLTHRGSRFRSAGQKRSKHRLEVRFESLELRRVLDCAGVAEIPECVPGDSNLDGRFDTRDLVRVFQVGKFETGEAANFQEGDWNEDGFFDTKDFVTAFRAGTYEQDVEPPVLRDLTELAPVSRGQLGPFGRPTVMTNNRQLRAAFRNPEATDAVVEQVDFDSQDLLWFRWQGSGADILEASVTTETIDGDAVVVVVFQYTPGATRDVQRHSALFAVSRAAQWRVERPRDTQQVVQRQLERWRGLVENDELPDGVTLEQAEEIIQALEDGDLALFRQLTADLRGDGPDNNGGNQDQRIQALLERWQGLLENDELPEGVTEDQAKEIIQALEDGDLALFRELTADIRGRRPNGG